MFLYSRNLDVWFCINFYTGSTPSVLFSYSFPPILKIFDLFFLKRAPNPLQTVSLLVSVSLSVFCRARLFVSAANSTNTT